MERKTEHREMLEALPCPAFLVKEGVISHANQAAIQRQINIGDSVLPLINIGKEEYEAFTGGRLNLALTVEGIAYPVSVTKCEEQDLFCLESEYSDAQLQTFALVSQCLREPLSDALATIGSIKHSETETNQELERKLQNINRNLHQFHRALCNMSDVARYDQSRLSRIENRNIVGIVDEIIDKASAMISSTGRILNYQGIPHAVLGIVDSEKLERAILNLISNAIKFASKGSAITTNLYQKNGKLYFSIENELPDHAEHLSTNLFARYLREPGLNTQNTGIGLGLTMVRKAAIAHGGTLLFEQPDSKHIRFTLSIAIKTKAGNYIHSPVMLPIDYAGGFDHLLVELSDILPSDFFE